MDRIESINRQRVLWCCAEKGVTPDELARDVGISPGTLAKFFEDELAGLTFLQLRKIAEYFGRGVLFFLDQGPAEAERVHTVQYRTLAGQKPDLSYKVKKLIEKVEKQRGLYLSLRDELTPGDYPEFAAPDLPATDIAESANVTRRWLNLGGTNTFDGYRAAVQAKGILVFRTNGYTGEWQIPKESEVLGFSLYDPLCPVIVVRKTRWETQQTFTLMHELGHMLLHRESSIDDANDMRSRRGREREANAFAGQLLVPDEVMQQIRDDERPRDVADFDRWLQPHRRELGVSNEAILRRLLDAGRLSPRSYLEYRRFLTTLPLAEEEGGNRQYRHREPKHIFGETYVRTVLDALSARRITTTKASAYLDRIKLTDLRQLEKHIAGL